VSFVLFVVKGVFVLTTKDIKGSPTPEPAPWDAGMHRTTKNTLAVRLDGQQKRARCEAQGLKPVSEYGQAKGTEGEPAWARRRYLYELCSSNTAAPTPVGFIDKTARILYNPVKKIYLYSPSMPGTQHAPIAHFARSLRPFSTSTCSFRNREWRETASSPDHLGLFSSS